MDLNHETLSPPKKAQNHNEHALNMCGACLFVEPVVFARDACLAWFALLMRSWPDGRGDAGVGCPYSSGKACAASTASTASAVRVWVCRSQSCSSLMIVCRHPVVAAEAVMHRCAHLLAARQGGLGCGEESITKQLLVSIGWCTPREFPRSFTLDVVNAGEQHYQRRWSFARCCDVRVRCCAQAGRGFRQLGLCGWRVGQ